MSGIDRCYWLKRLRRKYLTLDASIIETQDFATFANDMALLLKWRETKELDSWHHSFQGFAASWGCVSTDIQPDATEDPKARAFLNWFGRLHEGYLILDSEEREEFLDWLSLGAERPPIALKVSEPPSDSISPAPSKLALPENGNGSEMAS